MSNHICDLHLVGAGAGTECFPYYVYDGDGKNRRENITDWALAQFRAQYGDPTIGKWDIFYYVYGALHQPAYRSQFADALKRELPRIPYLADFWSVSRAGKRLAELHLGYEEMEEWPLEALSPGPSPVGRARGVAPDDSLSPISWGKGPGIEGNLFRVVDKMRLSKDKTEIAVNPSLTLRGIPAEAFEYKLGNRSALEWVIDQYQVKGGSDPNRRDDERYIVRLIGQVVQVSVETARIVARLRHTT